MTGEKAQKTINWLILSYLPVTVLIAILVPYDILDYALARDYTDIMASWIPYVAEVGRWTKVPVIQFIAAVNNFVAILWICILEYIGFKYRMDLVFKAINAMPWKKKIFFFGFCIPILITMGYLGLFSVPIDDPPGRKDLIMIGSKLGMGLYGSVIIAGAWFAILGSLAMTIQYFILIKRRYINK